MQSEQLRELGLRCGDVVLLKGLKREVFQFLNGRQGVVVGYRDCAEPNGQILVKLHNSDVKQAYAMRPGNVQLLHRVEEQPIQLKNRMLREQRNIESIQLLNLSNTTGGQSLLCELEESINMMDTVPGDPFITQTGNLNTRITFAVIERCCWYLMAAVTLLLMTLTAISSLRPPKHRWDPLWKNSTVKNAFEDAANTIENVLSEHRNIAFGISDANEVLNQFVPIVKRRIDDWFTASQDCCWVETGWCTPYGPAPIRVKFCHEEIVGVSAGFCQCGDERFLGKACSRLPKAFTCNEICFPNKQSPKFPSIRELRTASSTEQKKTAVVVSIATEGNGDMLANSFKSFEFAANYELKLPYVVFEPPVLRGGKERTQKSIDDQRKQISSVVSTAVTFNTMDVDSWDIPKFINKSKIHLVKKKHVSGMTSMTFRRISRFYTLFLHREDSVKDFDYIWRIPSDTLFLCKFGYNPIDLLSTLGKQIGFTMVEWSPAATSVDFQPVASNWVFREGIGDENLYRRGTTNKSELTGCQFHASSLIMSTRFLSSKKYNLLVSGADRKGGIFYHRWSETLIQSFAIISLLKTSDLFYLESSAVASPSIYHVPSDNTSCEADTPHVNTQFSNKYNNPCVDAFVDLAKLP